MGSPYACEGFFTDISSASRCSSIKGGLRVENGSMLSLSGIEALARVDGDVYIVNNAALVSLTGLEALASVTGRLSIARNANLTNLTALSLLACTNAQFEWEMQARGARAA